MSDRQSGSSFIVQSYRPNSSSLANLNICSGMVWILGIYSHRSFKLLNYPISVDRVPSVDSICSRHSFLREQMALGKLFAFVFDRSNVINSLKSPIHSGMDPILFWASARSLNCVNPLKHSGKAVSLFLERSMNLSLLSLTNDWGRVWSWLLSLSSLFNRLRFPKSLGSTVIKLLRILSPSNKCNCVI